MLKNGLNVALKGVDEIFSTEESRHAEQREQVQQIPIAELFPFKNHPFRVQDDEEMENAVKSISQYGVLTPLIARPRPEGGYEIISGHRRQHAAQLAGLETVPVIVRDMSDDAATILMVDSNLQRENILPSERAFAYKILNAELKEGQTSPPKHFTEDLLLHAMETASADSMPEGVERQGIGTPATRAATIEKLVQKGFLERKGSKKTKVLLPTDKGKALITVMPEEIQSPEMTADWEAKLLQIERSEMEPETFMNEIKEMISSLVKTTEAAKGAHALMKNKIIGVCPNCGANVVEREKGWFCENRECRFVLWKDNAFFKRLGKRLDAHVADKLLRDGHVRLKDCKSAKGKTYNATVLLSCEADGRSKFSLEFEGGC